MKKWVFALLVLIASAAVSVVSSLAYAEYTSNNECVEDTLVNNDANVLMLFDQYMNPEYETVDDVLIAQQCMKEQHVVDSVFLSIPEGILQQVARVIIGNNHVATKDDVIEEYLKNSTSIYRFLGDSIKTPPARAVPETIRIIERPTMRDTIINGQSYKIAL